MTKAKCVNCGKEFEYCAHLEMTEPNVCDDCFYNFKELKKENENEKI